MAKKGKNAQFELAKFTAKRDLYFAEIQDLYELSQNIGTPEGASVFLTRFRGFDDLRERFIKMLEVVNDQTFQLQPDFQPDYSLLREADRLRCSILEAANSLKKEDAGPPPQTGAFKLPKITLPEFDGEITRWPLFWEKFNTIIHSNPALDNLSKLHYLLGALKGRAQDVCVGFTPAAANYPVLVDALKARYDNKRCLADSFLHQILDLKPLSQESASGLSQLLVRFDTAYKSLQGLRLPDLTDFIMSALLLNKLDAQTRRAFETSQHSQIPSYRETYQFLHNQIEALSQLPKTKNTQTSKSGSSHPNPSSSGWKPLANPVCSSRPKSNAKEMKDTSPIRPCPVCGHSHQIYRCEKFAKLCPSDRLKRAQDGNWCFNCLSFTHVARFCNSKFRCRICNKEHHTLLHLDNPPEHPSVTPSTSEEKPTCNFLTNFQPRSWDQSEDNNIPILPTAVVLVQTPFGQKSARFLIDSGSQRHFVSLSCCRRLNLPLRKKNVPLEGMGSIPLQAIGLTELTLTSRLDSRVQYKISALVTERITRHLPPHPVALKSLKFFQNLPLADPEFFRPGRIDGILGVQLFGRILSGPAVVGSESSAYALPTKLGHVVVGDAPKLRQNSFTDSDPVSTFCILDNQDLHRAVQRFWEVEEVPKTRKLSQEEKSCEDLFCKSTSRTLEGRYCVELPFKEFPPILGDSRANAEKRFYSLERKFRRNPQFFAQYSAVIQDYLDQEHLTPVSQDSENSHYIPHFAVVKESSSTPLRIVFDASAKTSNGRSLNDVLFTGPKLQKDISRVLLAFRTSAVALVADIRQMYRNIAVHKKHRHFQRILWRNTPHEPLQTLELNCVVFGITSAPFLALRTVQQLASDEARNFPRAAKLASSQMYVDDLVVSLESVSSALEAYHQLVGLFRAGGFTLTKWISNSAEVLESIPIEDRLKTSIEFSDSSKLQEPIKVLGLTWDFHTDSFTFKIKSFQPQFTKRGILSIVARIWDPLGFLAPVTLQAKLIIKDIWAAGLDWDEELPPALHCRWQKFVDEFPRLHEIRIPRYFGQASGPSVTLVGFADSSEKGYGAVVYLRLPSDKPEVCLLFAKSRVAPQKTITLPKLELCAAVLLSELMNVCAETLSTHFSQISKIALTDSSVTLAWIKNDSLKRETFVANRIAVIERNLPPEAWFHVRSENNIADAISRGLSPVQLTEHPTWIRGPAWLQLEPDDWPIQAEVPASAIHPSSMTVSSTEPEVTLLGVVSENEGIEPLLRRFSSLKRLLRVIVYILRFCKRLPVKPRIEPSDLEIAEKILVRQVQQENFSSDIGCLQRQEICSSRLRPLSPFLDGDLLRVGGRLSRSALPYDAKHPLLLPKKSRLSTLVILDYHTSNFHTGPSLVVSLVRQRFWILSIRSLARKCIRECNFCFKMNPRPTYPPMADLPASRVQEAKPFLNTGVDYAGPFQISISRRRGVRSQKAYLCLFICLATKAIHLELASSLSTENFLACFQRFVARRGPIGCLYSDRGTNFIGAKAELDALHHFVQSDNLLTPLQNYLSDRRIDWKFNPPHAPHFGGIWEGNIRSVKTHLAKAIGNQILSYEEFNTVLIQIEALLNSRPLCSLSEDPSEPTALTPAHFLTLSPLQSLPLSATESQPPLRTRKELLDSIVRSFWKKWHSEYLTTLQPRKKWFLPTEPLKTGTVVVVKHDSNPPLRWPLGVVEQVHPGADGVIRVATVRIGQNLYQRPVAKLCPLPSQ